jgi:RNA recognition motif-containing protein
MNRRLYVGNLAYSTDEGTLENLFAQAGKVESVRVMRDMATGRSRGFGFIDMASEEAAQTAIEKFHEAELDGRRLAVNEARPQVSKGGGGGHGGGRGGGGGRQRREPRW